MERIATITLNDLAKIHGSWLSPKDAHDAIIAEAERRTGRVCVMFNDPGQNLWYVMATPLRLEV